MCKSKISSCFILQNFIFTDKIFSYIMVNTDVYKNTGVGLVVSKGEDIYDTRLTLIVGYLNVQSGYEGYYSMTYYDINNTSHPTLEQYLA